MQSLRTFLLSTTLAFAPAFACATEIKVPAGYTVQVLDVTKGEIARPDGWFYRFFTDDKSIVWTISKEGSKTGAYRTGMRVQFTPAINRFTGKSARELIGDVIDQKRKSAKVERLCNEERAGEFQRICMETTEPSDIAGKNFRILYTFSWSDEKQAVAITTFGAPEENWESLKDTIYVMSSFVLIGKDFWATK